MRSNTVYSAVPAPPDLPVMLQVARIRRHIAASDHVTAVLASLCFGEGAESWRFTTPETNVQGVQNV